MTAAVPRVRAITVVTVVVIMIGEAAVIMIVATATAVVTPRERLFRSHHTVVVDPRHQGAKRLPRLPGTALVTAAPGVAVAEAMLRTAAAPMVVTGIPGVIAAQLLRPHHLVEEVVATTPQLRRPRPTAAAAAAVHMVVLRSAAMRHHRPCHRQSTQGWKAEGFLPRVAPTPVTVGIAVEVIGGDGAAP